MIEVFINPLSVNDAWQGRRFKTLRYKGFERDLLYILPKIDIPEGKLRIDFEVCFRNPRRDIDNFVKPFLDVLQKKYGFNDNRIYELRIKKMIGKEEFVRFEIVGLHGGSVS